MSDATTTVKLIDAPNAEAYDLAMLNKAMDVIIETGSLLAVANA